MCMYIYIYVYLYVYIHICIYIHNIFAINIFYILYIHTIYILYIYIFTHYLYTTYVCNQSYSYIYIYITHTYTYIYIIYTYDMIVRQVHVSPHLPLLQLEADPTVRAATWKIDGRLIARLESLEIPGHQWRHWETHGENLHHRKPTWKCSSSNKSGYITSYRGHMGPNLWPWQPWLYQ